MDTFINRGVASLTSAGILLVLAFCPTAQAEVIMRIQWGLDGPLPELIALVKEGHALQKKINPDVGHELWLNEMHGTNTSRANLVVRYRDAAHFAEATDREDANAEWQSFLEKFPVDRYPTTYVGMSNTLINDEMPIAEPGTVMTVLTFDSRSGQPELVDLIHRAVDIQAKINPKANIRLVSPTLAGDDVGNAVVLVRYPSLADWAEGQKRNQQSDEWGEYTENFPADRYPIVYQGMSRALDID